MHNSAVLKVPSGTVGMSYTYIYVYYINVLDNKPRCDSVCILMKQIKGVSFGDVESICNMKRLKINEIAVQSRISCYECNVRW